MIPFRTLLIRMRPKDVRQSVVDFRRFIATYCRIFIYMLSEIRQLPIFSARGFIERCANSENMASPRLIFATIVFLSNSRAHQFFTTKAAAWLGGFLFFAWLEFGLVYCILSAIIALFTVGVGPTRRAGELSAYSVFNEGCETIPGSFTAEQFERQLRQDPNWSLPDPSLDGRGQQNEIGSEANSIGTDHLGEATDAQSAQGGARRSRKKRAHQERLRRRGASESAAGDDGEWEQWGDEAEWKQWDEAEFGGPVSVD
jgi:hypothetical protein